MFYKEQDRTRLIALYKKFEPDLKRILEEKGVWNEDRTALLHLNKYMLSEYFVQSLGVDEQELLGRIAGYNIPLGGRFVPWCLYFAKRIEFPEDFNTRFMFGIMMQAFMMLRWEKELGKEFFVIDERKRKS